MRGSIDLERLARDAECDARILRRVRRAMEKTGSDLSGNPTVAETLPAETLSKILDEETRRESK